MKVLVNDSGARSAIPAGCASVIVRDVPQNGRAVECGAARPESMPYDTKIVDVSDSENIELVERGVCEGTLEIVGTVN